MEKPKQVQLFLPLPHTDIQVVHEISTNGSVVIIGANGSGKSRLGSWIEFYHENEKVTHRIAAQKSLDLPESTQISTVSDAEEILFYGRKDLTRNKRANRWGRKPATHLLRDYQALMAYLFTEYSEQSILYRKKAQESNTWIQPTETKLDTIKRIWESILPHREITFASGKIETNPRGSLSAKYNGSEMSDGERVAFYLIGQVLFAPKNGIIIIDEPEIHLHKSIQAKLWDEIESERPDCLFIYLTHDLEFAASRINAKKIWLKGFDGKNWEWHILPELEDIPDEILYTILGSRKPVIFTEGTKDSLDKFIFSHLYPGHSIIPLGSCAAVIQATKSFQSIRNVHNLECRGIIDRDHRTEQQIKSLKAYNIFPLSISEIENILLTEEALLLYAKSLHYSVDKANTIVADVKALVFSELSREKEKLISSICHAEINMTFRSYNAKTCGKESIQSALHDWYVQINIDNIYTKATAQVDNILAEKNYFEALKLYNNKGLLKRIGISYDMKGPEFISFIQRFLASKDGKDVWIALKKYVPELS